MSNTYKAVSERALTLYGEDVFGADLSAVEERDQIEGGHLVIVPRLYKVLTNNYSAAEQGKTFEAALLVEQEAALIGGGHIERADKPAKRTK